MLRSARKTYRALVKLKKELSQDHSLSAMRIYADGSSVLVQDEQRVWEVETGQGHLILKLHQPVSRTSLRPPRMSLRSPKMWRRLPIGMCVWPKR